jgi:hypothetical protein
MSADMRQGTHWDGCWAAHHECAQAEVAALRADRDAANEKADAYANAAAEEFERNQPLRMELEWAEEARVRAEADRDTLLDALDLALEGLDDAIGAVDDQTLYTALCIARDKSGRLLARVRSHTGKDPA